MPTPQQLISDFDEKFTKVRKPHGKELTKNK